MPLSEEQNLKAAGCSFAVSAVLVIILGFVLCACTTAQPLTPLTTPDDTPMVFRPAVGENQNIVHVSTDVVRVVQSYGGSPMIHYLMGLSYQTQKKEVRFESDCASSCVVLAFAAAPISCRLPEAKFYVHAHFSTDTFEPIGGEEAYYPRDIVDWVELSGGWPLTFQMHEMRKLPDVLVNKHIPLCSKES